MTDREIPPLDDLIGKKVTIDGREWTIAYSDVFKRVMLQRTLPAEYDELMALMRQGVLVLQDDPAAFTDQPLPSDAAAASLEWQLLDAIIAGGRVNGSLTAEGIEQLERRLAQLTLFLSRSVDPLKRSNP